MFQSPIINISSLSFLGVLILLPLVVLLTPEVEGAISNFSASFMMDGDLINPLALAGDILFVPSSLDAGVLKVSPFPGVCWLVT